MSEKKLPHKDQRFIEGLKQDDKLIITEIYDKFYVDVENFLYENEVKLNNAKALYNDALTSIKAKLQTKKIKLKIPFGAYFYKEYRDIWYNSLDDSERKNLIELDAYKQFKVQIHKEQRIIEGLKSKKENRIILNEIYEKYYPELKRFVLKNSGNKSDAKDLFQKAIIALWDKVNEKNVILTVPFGGYFHTMYRNIWYNILRPRKGKNNPTIEDLEDYKHIITDYKEENNKEKILTLLEECRKNLGSDCKKILKLKYDDGMNAKEIMKVLNKPSTNSVHQAMFTCKKELKKCIESHPDFDKLEF